MPEPPASREIVVRARDLAIGYGRPVFTGASFEIPGGVVAAVIGPNGSGKSTLLHAIAGLLDPLHGSLDVLGKLPVSAQPSISYVLQGTSVTKGVPITVREAVRMARYRSTGLMRRLRAPDRARIDAALADLDIQDLAGRHLYELSGGQRQRVFVAPKLRQSMRAELQALQRRLGMTFVLVTHDQDEALALSDRIAVVNAGALEQVGPPREVYHQPATAFVADFVGHANLLPAERVGESAGRVVVRLAGGLEVSVPAERWPAGRRETRAVLRPEQVMLRAGRGGASGNIPAAGRARVTAVEFRGDREHLQLALDEESGRTLTAVHPGGAGAAAEFVVGAEVVLSVPADALWFLPAG